MRAIHDDPTDVRTPLRFARPVRLNTGRVIAEGPLRPSVAAPAIAEEFRQLTGRSPETFVLAARALALDLRESDEVVVRDAQTGAPLIVRRDDDVIVTFDLAATKAFEFADSKRPLYTYVPGFNIQWVPERLRRPLSNVVQGLKAPRGGDIVERYRTLPLTDFEAALLLIQGVARQGLVAPASPIQWPDGKRAAFVALHDIDTSRFVRMKQQSPLFQVEQKHGIKGTWFIPTYLLNRNPRGLDFLLESGCEVGWHGHNHDHRDHVGRYAEAAARALRSSWLNSHGAYATGMRAPKLLKSTHLFATLQETCAGLRYDTSFCNGIAPYHLWLNGRRSRLLEIPTTVPTDIRLYNELPRLSRGETVRRMVDAQLARTSALIEAGGVISIVTHPEACLSERPDFLEVYDEYLSQISTRRDIWFTTGGEIFRHWTSNEGVEAGTARSPRVGALAS